MVLAAYDGNVGAKCDFIIEFSPNVVGDILVMYNELENKAPEFNANVPLAKLGSDSVWQKQAAPDKC